MSTPVRRHSVVQPEDQSIKLIALTRGLNAIVDAIDYEWLMQWPWYADFTKWTYYAARNSSGTPKHRRMHREIAERMGFVNPNEVDHVDRNGLNNRRLNLRPCVSYLNKGNLGKSIANTSGYKGVSFHKQSGRWRSYITKNDKFVHLGLFSNVREAALAYDTAAREYFGEFALLNFPESQ
jgi:hypothetical protein